MQKILVHLAMMALLIVVAYISFNWSMWMLGWAAHLLWLSIKGLLLALLCLLVVVAAAHVLFTSKE